MLIAKSNNCENCGPGHANDCVAIYSNGWYCFSCNSGKSTGEKDYSYIKNKNSSSVQLPENYVTNPSLFSVTILKWLASYHVYHDAIKQHHIMYCPCTTIHTKFNKTYEGESLIFPVVVNNSIVFYQRRFFPNKQLFSKGENIQPIFSSQNSSDTLVIVEDYISAIRYSRIANALCLFGTNMKPKAIKSVAEFKNIVIHLDGDEPGQKAASELYNKLCDTILKRSKMYAFDQTSCSVRSLLTNKDPKCYSDYELKEILYNEQYTQQSNS